MILVMQQGGSSREFYAHLFDRLAHAKAYRRSCEEGAYNTSEPLRVPEALARVLRKNPDAESAFVGLLGDAAMEVAGIA